ncbi:MAG: PAS domain-containing sensor histidine kinase [Thermodesulfobacteriota bacterium]
MEFRYSYAEYGTAKDQVQTKVLHEPPALVQQKTKAEDLMRTHIQEDDFSRQIESRYLDILNHLKEGYFELDLTGNLTFFNDPLCRLFGCNRYEVVGANIRRFTDQQGAVRGKEALQRLYDTGKPISGLKWELIRKDGTKIQVESLLSLVKDEAGTRVGFRGTVWDITERKWAEEELRSSRQRLQKYAHHLQSLREKEKEALARDIHKEQEETFSVLAMYLSWLGTHIAEDQSLLLEKIKIMSGLVDRSKRKMEEISNGLIPAVLDDPGPGAAMQWHAEQFQHQTGITCQLTIDPFDRAVDRDRRTALFRIFQEMLANAARHAEATAVKVRLEERTDEMVLTVEDNGKGISDKQLTSSGSFGLMEMRERALQLGGSFRINGVKGKGTTAEVRIPFR